MYKSTDLKENISITDDYVCCPVKTCAKKVARQRKTFKKEDIFKCPDHEIYISPSTFEYLDETRNLLWIDNDDIELLKKIKTVKRESRLSRDNSEDAVTWNVFRYLERNKMLDHFLSLISSDPHTSIELILWSYSQREQKSWTYLNKGREEFGEALKQGSEPDIIIVTDETLFFIEAKVKSKNNTKPSNSGNKKKYTKGGNNWFSEVFKNSYEDIAIEDKKYELMRLWLIGTWVAKILNKKFYLVNLVLEPNERDIESNFGKHIKISSTNNFSRLTWETIYNMISNSGNDNNETKSLISYFTTKSAGYNNKGKINKNLFKITNNEIS